MSNFSQEVGQDVKETQRQGRQLIKTASNIATKNFFTTILKAKLLVTVCAIFFVLAVIQGLPITMFGRLHSYVGPTGTVDVSNINVQAFGGGDDSEYNSYYHAQGNALDAGEKSDVSNENYTNDANTSILSDVKLIVNRIKERADDIKGAIPESGIKQECKNIFTRMVNSEQKANNLNNLGGSSEVYGTGINKGLITARKDVQVTNWEGATVNVTFDNVITFHKALRILAAYNAQTTSRSSVKENGTTSYDLGKTSLSTWLGVENGTLGIKGLAIVNSNTRTITFNITKSENKTFTGSVTAYQGAFLPQYLYEQRQQDIDNRDDKITSDEEISEYNKSVSKKYEDNMCALVDMLMTVSGPSSLESCVSFDKVTTELTGKTQQKIQTGTEQLYKNVTEQVPVLIGYYNTTERKAGTSNVRLFIGTYYDGIGYIISCTRTQRGASTYYEYSYYPACSSGTAGARAYYEYTTETKRVENGTKPIYSIKNGTQKYTKTTYIGSATVNIKISTRDFDEIAKNMGLWCGDKDTAQTGEAWNNSVFGTTYSSNVSTTTAKEAVKTADKALLLTGYDYSYVVRYIAEASGGDTAKAKKIADGIYKNKGSSTPEEYVKKKFDGGVKKTRNSVAVSDSIYDICYTSLHVAESVQAMKGKFKNRDYAQQALGYDYVTVTQVVMREIGGENEENQRAVCQVIINRAEADNTNPFKIVSAKNQFSAYKDLWSESKTTDLVWDVCFDMFVLGNTYAPVKNAQYYYSTAGGYYSDFHESLNYITQIKLNNESGYHRFFSA